MSAKWGVSQCVAVAALCLAVLSPAAAQDDAVQKAIERGVEFLKGAQNADGTWPSAQWTVGATALAGLTLLECGAAPEEESVQKAAEVVRKSSLLTTHTYILSLSVLFLDRLGNPEDVPLIESMAVRLLQGQNASLGWTYHCPALPIAESRRLEARLGQSRELVGSKQPPKPRTNGRPKFTSLPKEIQDQVNMVSKKGNPLQISDNSNTQFAMLALWVARRHGIPVGPALAKVDKRFRNSQNGDGGWGYLPTGSLGAGHSLGTMTCAGLLGVGLGFGAAKEDNPKTARDAAKDPSVKAGLLFLGGMIGKPVAPADRSEDRVYNNAGDVYYFLWSLERVAVAFDLKTIGNKDWYAWGSKYLLGHQERDGGWSGRYDGGVDTCFALLFLRKANLAADLSAKLRGVNDPGEANLRAGGIGKPAIPADDAVQPPEEPKAQPKPPPKEPTPAVDAFQAEAARLSEQILKAPAAQQAKLIDACKEKKGAAFTQTLATVIHKLQGETREKAREALAERLARMTAGTLREKLHDDDPEVRRAAALACAAKDDKTYIHDLIGRLEDREVAVRKAAHAALKSLTNENFGMDAVGEWKSWWKKQVGR